MKYYPSIQANCPPPLIDKDQWIADLLMEWLNNQTHVFWHSDLDIRPSRMAKKATASSSFLLDLSVDIIATDFIQKGERLAFIPAPSISLKHQEDAELLTLAAHSIAAYSLAQLFSVDCRDRCTDAESTSIHSQERDGMDLRATQDVALGEVLSPCEVLCCRTTWVDSTTNDDTKTS